ncbi:MAG: HD domain-containing protein [Nitriliruptoraceae bacterium]
MTPAQRSRLLTRLLAGLLGLGLGGAWWLIDVAERLVLQLDVVDLLLFVAAAGVMEHLPIRLADGRAVPTSLAVIGTAAILGASPPVVALIAVSGFVLARVLARRSLPTGEVVLRAIGGWTLAGVAAVGVVIGPATWSGSAGAGVPASLNLGAAVAVALATMIGVPAVESLARLRAGWRFALRRIAEEVHRNRLVGAAIAATGALGALVHPVLGAWTLPTMLLPLVAARLGLDRLALGQRAYDQTIRAMSRLPEQLGNVTAEHGVRVADLAREVALVLGLGADSVAETVRAAHLHELGRIKLERESPAPQRELAEAGASVLREVGELDRVAAIVEAQADVQGRPRDDVGLPARIVVACCELDRYAPDPAEPGQRQEALVRLVRETGDLEVVAALNRVVEGATPVPSS